MKRLARITEAEVVAEFLKGEFYHREYDRDRAQFETLVNDPRLTDETENGLRRALLFRRRATMWRELPIDTQWWEVELEPSDMQNIKIFPRAQWRSVARGDFRALHVAELLRRHYNPVHPNDLASKINALRMMMWLEGPRFTILLIGKDASHPATVLEGNHRFVASLLLPPEVMRRRLRIVCGFSPSMEQCCWYKTSLPNLSRYLKNRIKHFWDSQADTKQWVPNTSRNQVVEDYAESAGLPIAKSK